MLRVCVKAVESGGKGLLKDWSFYSQYTVFKKYLTSQVFFMLSFYAAFEQAFGLKSQPLAGVFKLLNDYLYTLPTRPNTTNILIK